jgi:5-formyltetrahydrofolate cyclo-ligase
MSLTDPTQHPQRADSQAAKRALRRQLRERRDAIPSDQHAFASQKIGQAVAARRREWRADTVLLTVRYGSEWDSRPLVEEWLAKGVQVVLPRVLTGTRRLALHAIRDVLKDCTTGHYGILEPDPLRAPAIDLAQVAMIVVPGLAFDDDGFRLGYGGGYFDALVAAAPSSTRVLGAGFACQRVARVPRDRWDQPVQMFVSEAGCEAFS